MIVVPNITTSGNVLHAIIGPESELVFDIHGAAIIDITPLLNGLDSTKSVFLSLSRSSCEEDTIDELKANGINHAAVIQFVGQYSSNNKGEDAVKACCTAPDTIKPHEEAGTPKDASRTEERVGVCEYCNSTTKLLPIPGHSICVSCTQIELGLRRDR